MSITNPTSTQTWTTYIDFTEAWQFIDEDNAPTGPAAIRLQRFIDSACTVAQRGANPPFAPTQFRERHDGWAGDTISLHYSPFLQLVKATEWQSSGGPISLLESTPTNGLDGIAIDYATSMIRRTFDGVWPKPFFPGAGNIEITYMAGFNPVPPDIWDATVDLIAYKWRMTQESPRWMNDDNQYGGGQTNMLFPGVPNRIAEVFEAYRVPIIP